MLLEWILHLGGGAGHDCLIVADASVDWSMAVQILEAANKSFRRVDIVCNETPAEGWPNGPNTLFLKAAEFARAADKPFLWLEPDAIPLQAGWLERIAGEYGDGNGGYMGHLYDTNDPRFPAKVLSGIAVYPPCAIELIEPALGNIPDKPWDIAAAPAMEPYWRHTYLIQHFWGKKDLPPIFSHEHRQGEPVNTFTLADIHSQAVIFHRNKDGSLLSLLRTQANLPGNPQLVVVLPICNSDVSLMIKNLDWMLTMGMPQTHDCLISYDRTTQPPMVKRVTVMAKRAFKKVFETTYAMPRKAQFPQTAAWHHAARTMAQFNRNWLWLEADCVPLKARWLLAMQTEYDRCRKPFCGPVMHGRGHMNGTAIYPADTPRRLPRTMTVLTNAWDVEAQVEMGADVHDCTRLWQCAWGVVRGQLNPIEGEELPGFPRGSAIINQIRQDAVLFHRDKSGTLIDRLRERLKP